MKELPILFENDQILVVNKPAGLVVHPDGKTEEYSVAEWVLEHRPEMREIGESWVTPEGGTIFRPGIVHRIDRDTSGALVLCKTQEAFELMKAKFQGRDIEKTYHAFVYGEVKEDEGVIDRPIARSRKDFRLWSAQRGARGKERNAVTHFKVLNRKNNLSFLEVSPKTGRTHQIRVHLKAINHPVVCDRLYAPKREPVLGFDRLALHASKIVFELQGEEIAAEAPFPEDFKKALAEFGSK